MTRVQDCLQGCLFFRVGVIFAFSVCAAAADLDFSQLLRRFTVTLF
jgi:hypothetical protein